VAIKILEIFFKLHVYVRKTKKYLPSQREHTENLRLGICNPLLHIGEGQEGILVRHHFMLALFIGHPLSTGHNRIEDNKLYQLSQHICSSILVYSYPIKDTKMKFNFEKTF